MYVSILRDMRTASYHDSKVMKQKLLLSAAITALISGINANAQISSPSADGYLSRGIEMYCDNNYIGCIDQMTQAIEIAGASETADAYIALAAVAQGQHDALSLLKGFIDRYPESTLRPRIQAAIGDVYFAESRFGEALTEYFKVPDNSLTGKDSEDLRYHMAFSNLKIGEYDEAERGFRSLEASKHYANDARFYQGYIAYCRKDYSQALELFNRVDKSKKPGNRADYYIAQIRFIENDYSGALSLSKKLLSANTDAEFRPEMLRIAGESLYNLGDDTQAVQYLRQYASATESPLPSTLYILGISEYYNGDYAAAIESLGKVTDVDDKIAQSAYLYIGQAALKQGNTDTALIALDKAYNMDYDTSLKESALYNFAVAKTRGGRMPFGSSVTIFEDFIEKYPNSRYASSVQEYIVTGYMTDNNYESALRNIEKIKNPSPAILKAKQRVLYILGSRDLASGNATLALSRFKDAKSLASHDRDIARECDIWIGDCQYRLGKYQQASASYSSYIATSKASSNLPLAYYNLGYSRFGEKKYNEALSAFDRAIKSPGNLSKSTIADAYNRVGDCYYYTSKFSNAAANYDKAYAFNPEAGDYALFQKGMMSGLARDYKGKISIIDQLIEQYPSSGLIPSALLEKAESHIALDHTAEAIDIYKQLVNEYPATAQGRNGYLQLAITNLSIGNRKAAINNYRQVILSYPTSEEARVASDDLKRIYADDGNLDEYAQFIASVPNAPRLEAAEMDNLTFDAAEKAYLTEKGVEKLKKYIEKYPGGANEAQALYYLASDAAKHDNDNDALRYATSLLEKYPDAEAAEDILAIKGDIEFRQGKGDDALATFRQLEKRASATANIHAARIGILRVSRDLGQYAQVVAAADRLLASSASSSAENSEIRFSRAYALHALGTTDEAVKEWSALAKNTDDIYGAKAAYYLSQHYYDTKQYNKAEKTINTFIDANTPHQYWLARGFILLSDIYAVQGKDYEAREYLKSLRSNYPGTETDIQEMINQRLN